MTIILFSNIRIFKFVSSVTKINLNIIFGKAISVHRMILNFEDTIEITYNKIKKKFRINT